jgi:Domain of unknown function (DUF5666)
MSDRAHDANQDSSTAPQRDAHFMRRNTMNTARLRMLCLSIAALVTTGCGLLGGGSPSPSPAPTSAAAVSGTVQSVDAQAHTLTVGAGARNQMDLRSNDRTVLNYDSSTVVEYQGQKSYNPQDLEVGDQIEAQVERSGNRLLARNIKVVSSVSGSSGTSSATLTAWDATVRSVNSRDRTIELVQSSREQYPVTVHYDANTRVEFQGRSYKPEDLARDDGVQVRTHSSGSQLIADQIVVTRNTNGSIGAAGQQQLRGTIGNINTAARVIELDSVAFEQVSGQVQGFDATKKGNATTIAYDASTIVEYQGQRYGVGNLERGDIVSIDVSRIGIGYLAKRITVAQAH